MPPSADHRPRRPAALVCLLLLMLEPVWGTAAAQEVIANKDLPDTALTRNEARLFFTMRLQHWLNDEPVKVFVLPDDHPVHRAFAKSILGLFPYQLRRVWDRQLFSGTGQAPVIVADEAEMIRRVASTPNAIGYVETQPSDDRVRVLEVR